MNNNYEAMSEFLNIIRIFAQSNLEKPITEDFVYSQLTNFGLDHYNINQNVENMFPSLMDYYENNHNIRLTNSAHAKAFLWFIGGKIRGNEIKLYIPLDINHVYHGSKMLFDFIASSNMEHESKIAYRIRNDNVVVRVNTLEDAQNVINYVNGNKYIQEGLMKVNPFLPNYNGVGITMDNNYSYNSTVATIISEFVAYLKTQNRFDLLTPENLSQFIEGKLHTIYDEDLKDIYSLISKVTKSSFQFSQFVEHANNKLCDKYDNQRKRIFDPNFYFENAIIRTHAKYPQNVKIAIKQYLQGNPGYFTNDDKAREGLIKYVAPRDLISLMRNKLTKNGIAFPQYDDELIDLYVNQLINNISYNTSNTERLNNNLENSQMEIMDIYNGLKKAYIETLNKYGVRQAHAALMALTFENNTKFFTGNENRQFIRKNVTNVIKVLAFGSGLQNLEPNLLISEFEINAKNEIYNISDVNKQIG